MLVTASLMSEADVAHFKAAGNELIADNMDGTTECITLTTSGFDHFPPEVTEHLRKGMEIHLKEFGRLYLAALSFGFARGVEGMKETTRVVEESLKVLEEGLKQIRASG